MELRQLRVLQAVGETGSFSAAAERLDYTQPAVSKIVATLERQLGTTLVDRGIRPLRLTEAGSAVVRRAGAAFEQIAAAELEVEAIANLSAGSLRVGTFSSAGSAMVVDALRAFRTSHPDVEISEEHTSELQSRVDIVCRLLLEKNKLLLHYMVPSEVEDGSLVSNLQYYEP